MTRPPATQEDRPRSSRPRWPRPGRRPPARRSRRATPGRPSASSAQHASHHARVAKQARRCRPGDQGQADHPRFGVGAGPGGEQVAHPGTPGYLQRPGAGHRVGGQPRPRQAGHQRQHIRRRLIGRRSSDRRSSGQSSSGQSSSGRARRAELVGAELVGAELVEPGSAGRAVIGLGAGSRPRRSRPAPPPPCCGPCSSAAGSESATIPAAGPHVRDPALDQCRADGDRHVPCPRRSRNSDRATVQPRRVGSSSSDDHAHGRTAYPRCQRHAIVVGLGTSRTCARRHDGACTPRSGQIGRIIEELDRPGAACTVARSAISASPGTWTMAIASARH